MVLVKFYHSGLAEILVINMAKDLPYFRFTAQEWQNGDVTNKQTNKRSTQ